MEKVPQGGGGVSGPGDVQGMTGHGTQGSGLGDKVGVGHRLDLMALEVFSNLNDSVIPQFRGDCGGAGLMVGLHDLEGLFLP